MEESKQEIKSVETVKKGEKVTRVGRVRKENRKTFFIAVDSSGNEYKLPKEKYSEEIFLTSEELKTYLVKGK